MTASAKYVILMGAADDRAVQISGFDAQQRILYDWPGHTEFALHLAADPAELEFWHMLWFDARGFNASRPKIIINGMANADLLTRALDQAAGTIQQVQQQWPGTPVFNPPAAVLATTRDAIARRHADLPGLLVPRVERCAPASAAALADAIASAGLHYPVIVRPRGSHGGAGVALLQTAADAAQLAGFAFDGRAYYLTEFVDTRDTGGLYTKIRLVWLNGAFYPRHALTSDHWLVHARSRDFMINRPALCAREVATLRDFASQLSPDALASLHRIGQTSGLDYLGFDGAIRPDGTFVVFEINASQNAMAPSDYRAFPYLKPYVAAIVGAFNATVAAKIAAAADV